MSDAEYRDPKTGQRTAVLRPEDPTKALARLAEWNAAKDRAEAADPGELASEFYLEEADRIWLTMLREQGWRFLGWLLEDAKGTSGGAPAAPGDLHMPEKRFEKDFR